MVSTGTRDPHDDNSTLPLSWHSHHGSDRMLLAVISRHWPTKPFGTPAIPGYLPRNFAVIETGDDRGYVASSRSSLTKADSVLADVKIKDKLAELEEELHATFQPTCAMFGVLPLSLFRDSSRIDRLRRPTCQPPAPLLSPSADRRHPRHTVAIGWGYRGSAVESDSRPARPGHRS